jgi:hypothetical protein
MTYRNYPVDGMGTFDNHGPSSGVSSMATLIVAIFLAIILGTAVSFAYIYADDRGRTVRRQRLMTVRHVDSEEVFR